MLLLTYFFSALYGSSVTVEVTLVRSFEGAAGGLMFVCLLLSGFYVATERCRTRPVAIALLLLTLLAGGALN